jgi:hypothetical protein
MKIHSEDYKNKLKTVREAKSLLTYGNTTVDEKDLFSVKLHYNADILKSAMKVLEFDYRQTIDLNTEINYKYGIKVGTEYEYVNYGNYLVYKSEFQEDTKLYHITCYDKMLYSMKNYDEVFESKIITYPITIRSYINTIATSIDLEFKNIDEEFSNYNKTISRELYKGQGYTIRDVLDELAQVTASTICISDDDKLEVRYITETNDIIDEDLCRNVNVTFGKKYGPINSIVLSRSSESDNVYEKDAESIATNGLTEIKIIDNQIMNFNDRSDYLQDILTRLNGLEYYLNDYSSPGITYYDLCDRYSVKIGNNTYSCVMLNDEVNITQGLEESIYTEMPKLTKTDYTKADKTDRKINQTYLIVDKQNQEITALASKTDGLETKTSQLRLDVDKIEGQISDIADITNTVEGTGTLVMENINESEPIYIKIYPKLGDVTYLYPSTDLYPSDDLYPLGKALHFHCTSETYDIEYELPKDLLWLDNDTYDEFVLDYDNNACYVLRRVGILENGTKYALPNSIQEDLTYPTINLINGDYEIYMSGQPNAYLYVRLMVQNIYTTQFATKVEMNSKITQTKDEIDLEVSRKVGNDEIISKINQTPETITIQANKVNIGGMVTAINNNTATTINGNKISTGSITANQIKSGTITSEEIKSGSITTDKVSSDFITTTNFSSQNINADRINAGTISAAAISLAGTYLSPNSSSIAGMSVGSGIISNSRMKLDTYNGIISVFNSSGGSMILSNAARLSATAGIGLSSNSNGVVSAPSVNLDLKACSGATAYLACMGTASGTTEKSACECANGTLKLRSTGTIYANGVAIGGSSSRATKKNIKELSQDKKDELYDLIKNIPLKEYDYKVQYGKKENYGFIIEDIEDTKLNTLLHVVQNEQNGDIKNYSSEDLTRLELVVIQELMKKIEKLENKIKETESDK